MLRILLILCLSALLPIMGNSQKNKRNKNKKQDTKIESPLQKLNLGGLSFRSVGPALTSGRISDFAMHPDRPHEYYVATASGGVWKTINSGTTYEPIFDAQGSYSIGCVTVDPQHPHIVWVGTGENNNQRSVAYGDGIYKSTDSGKTWQHMGLKQSEHIGKIIVHPTQSNTIYVAAIGPLWNAGGDRGFYKSIDGGQNWTNTLSIDQYTGVNDIVMDPRNPDIVYASTFQRARHVFTYLGGGPGSGIYKSVDGGDTWAKITSGLPDVDLGRIGLSISPANPDRIYAIVEAARDKSGFFKSDNGGATWDKQSKFVTSGNYYQEIVADPIDANTIYAMDTWLASSHDGGKSFKKVGEFTKHVDNHCMWINPKDNLHWLLGCDGGIYETWDASKTWSYKANLPVTQFYKVSVDNALPFYNIYGGTQDNFSLGGPSRTTTVHGIMNSDWFVTNGGDGFETAIDHFNTDIVYAQAQYGHLVRHDRSNGEEVGIKPIARKDENNYRFNWDAPLIASPHKEGRVYFAANKVFRSDDYGNSWTVISDDLTRQINRNQLKIMDRVWSTDAVAKNKSTSKYGTIVAMSESTIDADLLVIGTDDGLIQITEDGGKNWRNTGSISGAPQQSYVNAVYTSHHDADVIYAIFNHHKYGDFKPYIFRSSNKGQTWSAIHGDLPKRGSVYSIEEDHIDPNLLFCGTEYGVFFTTSGGGQWAQLKSGVPTIAVRDIAIQRRENDLVLGTFGRGFYVLDDYSVLRKIGNGVMDKKATVYPIKDALIYEQRKPLGLPGKSFQGDNFYSGQNLEPSASIYYYYPETPEQISDIRHKREAAATKKNADNSYPTYEELKKEKEELKPKLLFTITNESGDVIRKLTQPVKEGIHRVNWDLRYPTKAPIRLKKPSFHNPFADQRKGSLVVPGTYYVSMAIAGSDGVESLTQAMPIILKKMASGSLPLTNPAARAAFQTDVSDLARSMSGAGHVIEEVNNKLEHIQAAILQSQIPLAEIWSDYIALKKDIDQARVSLYGDPIKTQLDIDAPPSPYQRNAQVHFEQTYSTAAPTKTHQDSYSIAKEEFKPILATLTKIVEIDIPKIEKKLEDADAPYTPGRAIRMMYGR